MNLRAVGATIFVIFSMYGPHLVAQSIVVRPSEGVYGEGRLELRYSPTFSDYLKSFSKKLLLDPLSGGMTANLGWIDIHRLADEIDHLKIYYNGSSELVVGSGDRPGAINLTEEQIVILNSALLTHISQLDQGSTFSTIGLETIILHEIVSALGYPDDNYELSTHFYMRSLPQDYGSEILKQSEEALAVFLKAHPTRQENNAVFNLDGGTSTGVGGGGDPASAAIKLTTYSFMYNNKGKLIGGLIKDEDEFRSVIAFIQNVRVEPKADLTPYDIRIQVEDYSRAITVESSGSAEAYISIDTALAFAVRTPSDMTRAGYHFLQLCLGLMR